MKSYFDEIGHLRHSTNKTTSKLHSFIHCRLASADGKIVKRTKALAEMGHPGTKADCIALYRCIVQYSDTARYSNTPPRHCEERSNL